VLQRRGGGATTTSLAGNTILELADELEIKVKWQSEKSGHTYLLIQAVKGCAEHSRTSNLDWAVLQRSCW